MIIYHVHESFDKKQIVFPISGNMRQLNDDETILQVPLFQYDLHKYVGYYSDILFLFCHNVFY